MSWSTLFFSHNICCQDLHTFAAIFCWMERYEMYLIKRNPFLFYQKRKLCQCQPSIWGKYWNWHFCQIITFWIVDIFINYFWYFHQLFDLRYQLIVPVNHWVQFCHKSLHNINNWTFNLFSGFINWLVASEGIICSRLFDCDHKRRQLTVASHQSSLIEYKLAPTLPPDLETTKPFAKSKFYFSIFGWNWQICPTLHWSLRFKLLDYIPADFRQVFTMCRII